MKDGEVIETGLTDQVLDDPREPYTQLLVVLDPAAVRPHDAVALELAGVAKTFTMHLQGGVRLSVVAGVELRGRARANAWCSPARPAPASRRS